MASKKLKRKSLAILLTIVLLILLGAYLYKNKDIFQEIKNVEPIYILPIVALILVALYVNGLFLKVLAIPFNIKLKEHFSLSISTSFLNLITPFRGGAGMRAIYMKKKHNLKYSDFISSLFGNYIIIFLINSFAALAIFTIIYFTHKIFNIFLSIIFLTIFLGTISLISFDFKFKKENILTSKINKVLKGWRIITKHKNLIPKLISLSIINLIIIALINQLVFLSISIEINIIKSFYLSVIQILAIFINITPGSLGITESLYLISANIIKISPGITLVVALIIRAINTITLLILGPIANFLLIKKFRK